MVDNDGFLCYSMNIHIGFDLHQFPILPPEAFLVIQNEMTVFLYNQRIFSQTSTLASIRFPNDILCDTSVTISMIY